MTNEELGNTVTRLAVNMENFVSLMNDVREDVRLLRNNEQTLLIRLTSLENSQRDLSTDVQEVFRLLRDGESSFDARIQKLQMLAQSNQAAVRTLFANCKKLETRMIATENKADAQAHAKAISKSQLWAGILGLVATAVLSLGAILAQVMK